MSPTLRRRNRRAALLAAACACLLPALAWSAPSYTLFESGQVRPLAQAGGHLFAVNTPDNRLEIFDVTPGGLAHLSSVPVGLEPVAVAVHGTEAWVVNHLSDSISVVDVSDASTPRVVRTLLVGDEPRDIVFAGPGGNRAFITTAHRGQNTPHQIPRCAGGPNDGVVCTGDTTMCPGGACTVADIAKPGVGRADVWVFDATAPGDTLTGTPVTIVTLFGDTPRALAVSPDGTTVYAAIFQSGNRTTTLSVGAVCAGGASAAPCGKVCASGVNMHANCSVDSQCPGSTCVVRSPGGLPAPNVNHASVQQPEVGLIVKYDGTHWVDELGRWWDNAVNFSLPDEDVFAIDATLPVPAESAVYTGVGTVLFNMAVNPASGKVYVANTDAQNDVRFEGPGTFAALFKPPGEPASVRGHLVESRISVLDGASVTPRHLNKHIDYTTCCADNPAENAASLAFPLGMAVSSDGATLYVAGFGSSKIGIYSTAQLESDTFTPGASDVTLTGLGACPGGACGPTGLVLDEANTRLYVMTRFDNGISEVSTGTGMETAHHALHNPEPASIVNGRRFNYDARFTSSHGDSACASCHVFADFDSLAWDLGDPDGDMLTNPGPFTVGPFPNPPAVYSNFHPMKGPMTTQSLRGMANHGPMHWRGDRTGGNDAVSSQPHSGTFDENAAFKKFNVAFPGLLGRSTQLSAAEMQAYTDFILQVTYPPNPIQNVFNGATNDEIAGRSFYDNPITDTVLPCNGCHVLNPLGNAGLVGVDRPGFFGGDGRSSFEGETQHLKIPHLRNMYQKVGMFGMIELPGINPGNNLFQGDQIRGFGFLHDGSIDTLFRFHNGVVFNQGPGNPSGIPLGAAGNKERRSLEALMMAFPSNLQPIVGQQATLTSLAGYPGVGPRLGLLRSFADGGACDLVVKGRGGGEDRGYLYIGNSRFESDRANEPPLESNALNNKANVAGQELTFTCVPPGSGVRIALDRDADGYGDSDERDLGSDPDDAASLPTGGTPLCQSITSFVYKQAQVTDHNGQLSFTARDVPLGTYTGSFVGVRIATRFSGHSYGALVPGASFVLKGHTYKYKAPRGTTGITQIQVKQNQKQPNLFQVQIKTKAAWPLGTFFPESPSTTDVQINVAGTCFNGAATKVKQ